MMFRVWFQKPNGKPETGVDLPRVSQCIEVMHDRQIQ